MGETHREFMVKHMENLWKTYGIHGEPWSLKYDFLGISDSELGFLQYRWGFFFLSINNEAFSNGGLSYDQ
jgi:hypothetical protein